MLDSFILLKLAALGCFGIIITAIASFHRWIEEESYQEDEPELSACIISPEHNGSLLLPVYLPSASPLPLETQGAETEEGRDTAYVRAGLDESDASDSPAFQSNGTEIDRITDPDVLTAAGDSNVNECLNEQACEEKSAAFHGTCTKSNKPGRKTHPGLVTIKRANASHTSVKQTPPVDELVSLAQQCLSSHSCKGNIRYRSGVRGDRIIDISIIVPGDRGN